MTGLAQRIEETKVPTGSAAMWWLAQAGFVFKAADGTVALVDPYLSDAVERECGFKRLSLAPISAAQVRADFVISSHEHPDHLDPAALPVIAALNPRCRFAGPVSCEDSYTRIGISTDVRILLGPGEAYDLGGIRLRTALADHGELSPSALSFRFGFGAVSVVFTGDTALRLDLIRPLVTPTVDVLVPCINGRFGNMDALQAAQLTAAVRPRVVVPCHFWMFAEHNGDPEAFVRSCAELCPSVEVRLLCPGEGILVSRGGVRALEST